MIRRLTALVLLTIAMAACARPDYVNASELSPAAQKPGGTCAYPLDKVSLCLEARWEQTPDSTKYNSMTVTLKGDNVGAFDEFTALLWMPSMGHGSSPVRIEKIDDHTYRIYDMYFVMRGDWEVRIVLKAAGQNVDQVFIPVLL